MRRPCHRLHPDPDADPHPDHADTHRDAHPDAHPSPTSTPTPTPTPAPTDPAASLSACQTATAAVLTAQQAVADAQSASADRGPGPRPGSRGVAAGGRQGEPRVEPHVGQLRLERPDLEQLHPSASTTRTAASTTPAPSAADLLADRAAIDLAAGRVDVATSDLGRATVSSPIAGTVAAISMAVGGQVQASSTSSVITVIGAGWTVTTTVPLASIDALAVGQTATATVRSSSTPLSGKVSSIGVMDASTTGDPAYAVVVALDPTQVPLFNGASAELSIDVAGSKGVVTVPTSAVHVSGSRATVEVLRAGSPVTVVVTRGAVGTLLTEITSGVSAGDVVVIADPSQPLPSQQTSSSSSGLSSLGSGRGGRAGQFPGGQFPGGFGGRGVTGG